MARSTTERLAEKTSERQFLYELETDFELAPAASRAVLATAQQVLLVSGGEPRQGQMQVTVVSVSEPSGKPLAAMKKVSVVVTVDGGLEDLEVLRQFGVQGVRRARVRCPGRQMARVPACAGLRGRTACEVPPRR